MCVYVCDTPARERPPDSLRSLHTRPQNDMSYRKCNDGNHCTLSCGRSRVASKNNSKTIQKQFTHNYRILRGLKTTCLIAHAMRCQSRRMYISFHLVEFYQKTCTFYQIIWSTQWKEMYILPKEMYILPNHLVECTSLFRRSNNSIARAHARCQSRRPRMCDKRCHVREMSFWGHEMSFWGHVYMYIYVFCRNLVSFIGLFCKREL